MMVDFVYGQDEIVARFVAQMIPHATRGFENCVAIGVINDEGVLIAGVVFHNWNPEAGIIEMSAAALPRTNWITRETVRRVFAYPFEVCGCQMIAMQVRADNERLLRWLASLGYMFISVPRMLGRDVDGVLCLLTDDEYRTNRIHQRCRRDVVEPMKEAA